MCRVGKKIINQLFVSNPVFMCIKLDLYVIRIVKNLQVTSSWFLLRINLCQYCSLVICIVSFMGKDMKKQRSCTFLFIFSFVADIFVTFSALTVLVGHRKSILH